MRENLVLQDRLARLGGGDRTKEIPIAEWERVYRKEAQARRLLHQARVLGRGTEKSYYYAHRLSWGHLWLEVISPFHSTTMAACYNSPRGGLNDEPRWRSADVEERA